MTTAREKHSNDIVVGAGEVFIDLLDAAHARTGERYIGDSTGASISVETEQTTVFSGDGPIAQKLVDFQRSISHTMTCTVHDMSPDNIALFLAGEVEDEADTAAAVSGEKITVKQGLWYQLGVKPDTKPAGIAKVKPGTVTVATKTKGTDFDVDADHGRIYIIPKAGISDNTEITVGYTPVASTRRRAKAGERRQVRAAVRYIEDPSAGRGSNWYIRQASIGASGEMALKSRDTEQSITLTISIEVPEDGTPAVICDGQPA